MDGSGYLKEIRGLLVEYARFLGRDLTFQHFQEELEHLDQKYTEPNGRICAAVTDAGKVVGCVAFRKQNDKQCEMKRLYVEETHRKLGVGRKLVETILEWARADGYEEMVLDSLQPLESAIALYKQYGFKEIPAYYENPMPDVIYMGRNLS